MSKKCPKCGSTSGWGANVRASGWAYEFRDWDGISGGMNLDYVRYSNPKYVKCDDCGKKVLKP